MLKAISIVLKDKKYKYNYTLIFLIILALAAFLMNFISLPGFLQGRIIFVEAFVLGNFLFLFLFSLLAALALTLHVYKYENMKDRKIGKSSIGVAGAFIGMFTSACSVCYPLILTLLGIPTALAILPFGGIEIYMISVLLLLLSIYMISKSIENYGACKVEN